HGCGSCTRRDGLADFARGVDHYDESLPLYWKLHIFFQCRFNTSLLCCYMSREISLKHIFHEGQIQRNVTQTKVWPFLNAKFDQYNEAYSTMSITFPLKTNENILSDHLLAQVFSQAFNSVD